MMIPTDVTHFATPADFRRWFEQHHDQQDALWVGYWKKATGRPSVTWEETVDQALCFGWIDGIRKTIDDEAYTIRFTPRRPKSIWSLRNVERFAVLKAEGLIQEAGFAAWNRRKKDKTGVYAYEIERPTEMGPEYLERLKADDEVWAAWESRAPGHRKKWIHWVMTAKKPETRERRIVAVIEELKP